MQKDHERFDVVVIGAGPAGVAAASNLASHGVKVALLEKGSEVGLPVRCAEYVPAMLGLHFDIPSRAVAQKIDSLITNLPDGSRRITKTPGFILNRDYWQKHLVREAVKKGVVLLLQSRLQEITGNYWLAVRQPYRKVHLESDFIIGADGPNSLVRQSLQLARPPMALGFQYQVPLKEGQKSCQVFFNREFYGGYAWFFPKGSRANLGVAVSLSNGRDMKCVKNYFYDSFIKDKHEPLSQSAGLIPVGGMLRKLGKDRVLLAGDAAGLTHPITGAGISSALISGEAAASAIIKRLPTSEALINYEEEMLSIFGRSHDLATMNRFYMEKSWSRDYFQLSEVIKKTWIAFPEYRDKNLNQ